MKQPDDKNDLPPDGYDPRQRDPGRPVAVDDRRDPTGAEYHRLPRGEYPQGFRADRMPRPRDMTVDEFDGRDDAHRSMAVHPLFRGLLQELPPRSSAPSKEWLDRWSETARSILDLLYSRDNGG
ncbi:hypothetical protein LX16_5205 [Stackebrandtia albiflava]|uniref:Uncharacterized protein n=1 Tax=Stackebrandtia albiflava TaxID=406432 RepID=A0A562ULI7_9ACTN|nr:hypothetical protein [Stackebrandtia albiflava]TWJ06469.1 hypothetical protein LX16_5205 [Stackebrandtia albiflava]